MKRKILIIEDEKPLAQVLEDTFSQEGFEIIKAFDGENGVDKFYNEKPDLIHFSKGNTSHDIKVVNN